MIGKVSVPIFYPVYQVYLSESHQVAKFFKIDTNNETAIVFSTDDASLMRVQLTSLFPGVIEQIRHHSHLDFTTEKTPLDANTPLAKLSDLRRARVGKISF
ncbi:hypothetical protein V202x_00080 [Gimesia aquarii]|uniref:Uncharacterized protein n=1 Tax=Gimesia aquarii TaxID=2527964 RepID=A0A517WN48_9PLAN|nr:hypothetical protein V202x_00080 [Gimesia aquarii]